MRQVNKKSGFTMVELSLSIAFIAVLSIIVVVMIGNAVSAYHRGLTLNQINTTGMDVVEDMRVAVQNSPARSVKAECASVYENSSTASSPLKLCETDQGMSFIMTEFDASVNIGNDFGVEVPMYGAFCTGKYSYLWNSGYLFSDEYTKSVGVVNLIYKSAGGAVHNWQNEHNGAAFKLLKVADDNRAVCKVAAGMVVGDNSGGMYRLNSDHTGMPATIDISNNAIDEEPADILAGNNNLALYDLSTTLPAESGNSNNMFYTVSFVLGTVQGGINVKAIGNYCATPEGYNSSVENFDYCAINKFNFAAQATGG